MPRTAVLNTSTGAWQLSPCIFPGSGLSAYASPPIGAAGPAFNEMAYSSQVCCCSPFFPLTGSSRPAASGPLVSPACPLVSPPSLLSPYNCTPAGSFLFSAYCCCRLQFSDNLTDYSWYGNVDGMAAKVRGWGGERAIVEALGCRGGVQ